MASAKLVVHAGGVRRDREALAGLECPERTRTWTPVRHADLVAELVRGLTERGITVGRDDYCTLGRDDARLFGVMDLIAPTFNDPDYSLALGLQASNDKSMAIKIIVASRVFVCDNLAFSGSAGAVTFDRKHTGRLDLGREIPPAVDRYMEKANAWRLDLGRMKEVEVGTGRAKELIFDAFAGRKPVLPVRLLPDVARYYFDDEDQRTKFPDRTLWSLNNAFTEAVKALPGTRAHRGGVDVGRYFGRALAAMLATPSIN